MRLNITTWNNEKHEEILCMEDIYKIWTVGILPDGIVYHTEDGKVQIRRLNFNNQTVDIYGGNNEK